jgi:hypothetical protein
MPHNPAIPNQYDSGLIPYKVRAKYFEEYLGLTPLTVFMGSSSEDAIQVFETQNGDGLSYRVGFRKDINYQNPIIGFDQAAGSEQEVTIYMDEIKLNLLRFVDVLMGVPIVRKSTPIDVYDSLKPLLLNAQRRNLIKSILDSACGKLNDGGLYNSGNGGTGPTADRAIYNGHNHNASIFTAVGGMNGAADYSHAGLSVSHIRALKSLAVRGGLTLEAESRIKPIQLKNKRGFPEEIYVYLMDPDSYVSLAADPAWTNFMYRGVIQNNDQPEGISGARYRGMIEGVMIYECPELARYRVTNTQVAAWNLFIGAQAFGLCWAQRPWFEIENRDFNLNAAMAVCEIRGQKAFVFPSFQNPNNKVERGIIHSFVRIA